VGGPFAFAPGAAILRAPRAGVPLILHRSIAVAPLAALCLAFPPSAAALDPRKVITQYGHDSWQIEDGLPNSTVRAFAQTRDGYLWVGTEEGLARFDGVRFVVFDASNTPELREAFVTDLHEDRSGNLWIATSGGGLVRYRDGRFTSYLTKGDSRLLLVAVAEDAAGTLWIGAQVRGLLQLKDGALVAPPAIRSLPLTSVTALHVDPAGRLWMGSRREGVASLKDGAVRAYTVAEGLSDNQVWSFTDGPDGSLWIGTEKGLSHLAADGTITNSVPGESIRALLTDRDGSLWIGSNEGGVRRLGKDGQAVQFSKAQGLSSISVRALYEDREGSLWIGNADGGLNRFRDGPFTTVSQAEGLSEDRTTALLADDDGAVWVGTNGGGLNRIQDGRITAFTTREGLSRNSVSSVGRDRAGTLWAGTNGAGLNRLRAGRFSVYTTSQGLANDSVFALLGGRDGGLWVGTRGGGLNRFAEETFTLYGKKEGLSSSFVWALAEDPSGTLWIGSAEGVYALAAGQLRRVIPDIPAHHLHVDADGAVWAGTARQGLYRFKGGRTTVFTSREGLQSDTVSQILEDGRQNLWLGSNKGISRVSKGQLDDVAEGRTPRVTPVTYDTADGMKSPECNYGSGCKTKDGRLWFPTIRGVVVVDPERLRPNPLPPPVMVERVLADGRDVSASPVVPPGDGRLEFQFTALSHLAPRKVRFSYRLEGFDETWRSPGPRRDATYTNLRPGWYTFRVKASNNDGVWNETGAAFPLYLQPHYYQTGWFYALCAALAAAVVWRIHLFRVHRLVELERVRTRIAADLHDDIGAGLSQIAVLSEVARQQFLHDGTRALDSLGRIAGTAGELVDSMSDIVWAVNPRKDRLEDLVHRMRRFANDVAAARGVEIDFETSGAAARHRLVPDFRRHVYLIFKEGVSNAVRHSGCARVGVVLEVRPGELRLQVKDDGRGFDGSLPSDGHGLETMVQRAAELGGRAEIASRPGQGTVLTAQVPFARPMVPRWWRPTHLNR
jgi:ligand-binding sensor domain-containing protein/signal transduction histidine kinase